MSLPLLAAADAPAPAPLQPKSPKATDAIRMEQAAIRKASATYWLSCTAADQHLLQELKTAADAAHNRNDGAEEQACLDVAKDVNDRITVENAARIDASPVAPLKLLRCEEKDQDKKD